MSVGGTDRRSMAREGDADRSVAVVGAGAFGATVADELTRRGASVRLYERGSIGSGASGRAAGLCYAAATDPLSAEIATESIEAFRARAGPDTFEFTECPYVWLARAADERRIEAIESAVETMQSRGLAVALAGPDALSERFPAIETDDVGVAAVAGAAGYLDPGAYTAAVVASLRERGGEVRLETPVSLALDPLGVVPTNGGDETVHPDAVVLAAGAHTPSLLAAVGIQVPVVPYRVQALTAGVELAASDPDDVPMCYDATDGSYFRPHSTGLLAGNGSEDVPSDPDAYRRGADPGFPERLAERVAGRLRARTVSVESAWAGLCTATADGDPLVGEIAPGLFVATGFQGHGLMRTPAIARRLAAEVLGGDGIPQFDPGRFDGDEPVEITEGMAI